MGRAITPDRFVTLAYTDLARKSKQFRPHSENARRSLAVTVLKPRA